MSHLTSFAPRSEEYFDIEEIISEATAEDISDHLMRIESDIKTSHGIKGPVVFSMSPNSLCASWAPNKTSTPLPPAEDFAAKKQRRMNAIMERKVGTLKKAEESLGLTPRDL